MAQAERRRPSRRLPAALLLIAANLVACTAPETYPGSGEACGEDDPVRGIRAGECLPSG